MRIDLPLCDFINCRYRFDGNCKDGNEYNRCQYHRLKEQEPCEDAISRQAVFETIDDCNSDGLKGIFCSWKDGERFKEYIKELLPVTTQQKIGHWIMKDGKEQQRTGYDIAGTKTWYIQIMCDKCGFIKTAIEGHTGQYHYCPNCGAKMVEPQESEEKKE